MSDDNQYTRRGVVKAGFVAALTAGQAHAAPKPKHKSKAQIEKEEKEAPPPVFPPIEKDESGIPKVFPRGMAVPASHEAHLTTETKVEEGGLYIIPKQGEQAYITLTKVEDNPAFQGCRAVTPDMIVHPRQGDAYLKLGAFKVPNVEPGSALMIFELAKDQSLQLNKMPGSMMIGEIDGIPESSGKGKATQAFNNLEERQLVVLIIPPDEHSMRMTNKIWPISDLEAFRQDMVAYKTIPIKQKPAMYEQLENRAWQMYARNMEDVKIPRQHTKLYADFKDHVEEKPGKKPLPGKANPFQMDYDSIMKQRKEIRNKDKTVDFSYSDEEVRFLFSGTSSLLNQFAKLVTPGLEQAKGK